MYQRYMKVALNVFRGVLEHKRNVPPPQDRLFEMKKVNVPVRGLAQQIQLPRGEPHHKPLRVARYTVGAVFPFPILSNPMFPISYAVSTVVSKAVDKNAMVRITNRRQHTAPLRRQGAHSFYHSVCEKWDWFQPTTVPSMNVHYVRGVVIICCVYVYVPSSK